MSRWRVYGTVTISVCAEVEAETEAEARKKSEDFTNRSLCHSCTRQEDDEWIADELDGDVRVSSVEEIPEGEDP